MRRLLKVFLGWMAFPVLIHAQLPALKLIRTIQCSELTPPSPSENPNTSIREDLAYGFIEGGRVFYLGRHQWAFDLDRGELVRYLADAFALAIAPGGDSMLIQRSWPDDPFWQLADGSRIPMSRERDTPLDECVIHPDGKSAVYGSIRSAGPQLPEALRSLDFRSMDGSFRGYMLINGSFFDDGRKQRKRNFTYDDYVGYLKEFTRDGKYLIVVPNTEYSYRLIDLRRKRFLPADPEVDRTEARSGGYDHEKYKDNYYIAGAGPFVFNRDASWVAGGYGEDGMTFVWDRKRKALIWKKDEMKFKYIPATPESDKQVAVSSGLGSASAFSPNDKYLLCQGVIVHAASGELAFSGLKGTSGKFSPDGRSLVTLDDEAFYVYTLPPDSPPIFGVFQKPEPWSPPKASRRKRRPRK